MSDELRRKFNDYGTLVTVASLILIVVYSSGGYDGWDALVATMGIWFGGYYLIKKVQFDWPSQILASLVTSFSAVLLWESAVSIWNHYCSNVPVEKCEPLTCPSSAGGISGLLVAALVLAVVLTLVSGKPKT